LSRAFFIDPTKVSLFKIKNKYDVPIRAHFQSGLNGLPDCWHMKQPVNSIGQQWNKPLLHCFLRAFNGRELQTNQMELDDRYRCEAVIHQQNLNDCKGR
jgi:hypothetical protein